MYNSQAPCRELYEQLLDYDGASVLADVLLPWIAREPGERAWLHAFAARQGTPFPSADGEDLCRLYTFSRVSDLLLLRFPVEPAGGVHAAFMKALGLTELPSRPFRPIFHEIVQVEASTDARAPIEVVAVRWPGWALGAMVFARAGCVVRGGAEHIDPEVATRSRMYWTHRRPDRPTMDGSEGWGSNSQWRTPMRRDYVIEDRLLYNVDGDDTDRLREDGFTVHEIAELVRHRCFIRSRRDDDDLWPLEARWVEEAG